MNPGFIDPNNHVPDVSEDDGWDNAQGYTEEGAARTATVLPPRRKVADRAPETTAPAETGLRIGSSPQRLEPADTPSRLVVQEINGGVIRLEQEVPPPPKVERQFTFHPRPAAEKDAARQQGESKEWGIGRLHGHHWVVGGGLAVVVIVIGSMLLLPAINAPNKPREQASQPLLKEEKDARLEIINRLLEKQPEAIQLFRSYSQAAHVDEIVPLVRDGAAMRELLKKDWKPLNLSKQWAPSIESKWSVFDRDGRPGGLLEGSLPDGSPFSAYVTEEKGRLLLDWKATNAYCSATYSDLEKGTGDSSEIRGELSTATYYGASLPEEEYRSFRMVSPDQVSLIWCYARRGTPAEAEVAKEFQSGEILKENPAPRKITLRLKLGPEGTLPNQWVIAEMLHIDWVTP
ncbi:MAG: hypothetical protein EOP88_14945 [Verrucomicrobiaceae bacterium]|nr:MAG: hypothetical protein EOP88_14945 [Verrucomicrobiaceae bacterium]